jgi:histidyl-tRNA synthetase
MPTIPTQPYKGTRDFYPDELLKRNYIFETWRTTLITNGFNEYDASLLENAEMYIAKSGEELGAKQLYHFVDKGDRSVALRPEMTPTLARMVANKYGDLRFPLRWFSIPNCFRYEQPQKGRTREFWQLNVDIIGSPAGGADLEILTLTGKMFIDFGADKSMFKIMFNHRILLDNWLDKFSLTEHKTLIYAVLDDWHKLTIEQNRHKLSNSLSTDQIQSLVDLCTKTGESWSSYLSMAESFPELQLILNSLSQIMPEVEYEFSPTIIRGIAYYTGLVFEGFNKNPVSPRAMFGAGRYDNLLDLFGKPTTPAVGFGVGDVTWHDFLTEWNLWPNFSTIVREKVGIMALSVESLTTIFTETVPALTTTNITYDIDYNYQRSENKRYETLKKRGCTQILKV